MSHSEDLGTKPIGKLIWEQAGPASIGFLVMSIYGIVDTIFVGRWVGSLGIGAITVVMPITFLIASIGMAIGVGGASVISRSLGAGDEEHALHTFGNQVSLTLILSLLFVLLGAFFQEPILNLFGGKGDILPFAKIYFMINLLGIPFLAWAMMSNNVIRAEGQPKVAMMILLVPAIVNLILDPILIVGFKMGMHGAAWATTLSYVASASFAVWYFLFSGKSEMKIKTENLILKLSLVKEIFSIGMVTLARQGTVSLLAVVLNNALFKYGGEMSLSVFGIINRLMMLISFPVLGLTQGFLPIAGYNYGAKKYQRLREAVSLSLKRGTVIALILFLIILFFAKPLASLFTEDTELINQASPAILTVFLATPLLIFQFIGGAYYQALGKAIPALLLSMLKQGFCLVPLILILPLYFGLTGIWIAFPIADALTAMINYFFLRHAMSSLKLEV